MRLNQGGTASFEAPLCMNMCVRGAFSVPAQEERGGLYPVSKAYNPEEIELKWQSRWADAHCFEAEASHEKPKFYALIEFPYPSGAGLHVGHPRSNTAMDIIARKRRMEGYNVLFPIGWDAFACRRKTTPSRTTCTPPA